MADQFGPKASEPTSAHHMADHARRLVGQLITARSPARSRGQRLEGLNAPLKVRQSDKSTAVKWLQRALRSERGLALRGAAQYNFTRHVALLRALEAELQMETSVHQDHHPNGRSATPLQKQNGAP